MSVSCGICIDSHAHSLCRYFHEDEVRPFDAGVLGAASALTPVMMDEFETKLHFFMEDCDNAQGFQVGMWSQNYD